MEKRNYLKNGRNERAKYRRFVLIGLSAGVAVYLIASLVLGEMGLIKYFRMHSQYNALMSDIEKLKRENTVLGREVRLLRTDPEYLERIARDKLGLARPGEIVYYYADP